ncbi:DUF3231 family protein [Natronospora cellulosivora (SeqCode)]
MKVTEILNTNKLFKKSITNTEEISISESYNIFDALRSRYISLETNQIFINFIHDREFDIFIKNIIRKYKSQIKILENLCEKFNIPAPSKPPADFKTSAQIGAINDKIIFRRVHQDLIAELYSLAKTITTTITNDNLRDQFNEFTNSHLDDYDSFQKFGKVKGWADIVPSYNNHKPTKKENLAVSEAAHLWDIIALRYHQLQMTSIFLEFVHDEEFRLIIKKGKSTLHNQIKTIEEKLKKEEIPLPEKPLAHQKTTMDPESINDAFIFMTISDGIRRAIHLHIRSIIETVKDDNSRSFYKNLYTEEISIYSNFIKYGKVKGWIQSPPKYMTF